MLVIVALSMAYCGGEASPEEVERELDGLLDDAQVWTIRDCSCGDEASGAAGHSGRFDDWPDYEACHDENRSNVQSITAAMADNQPFVLEYLDPRIRRDRPVREYWHHDSRRGTFYFQTSCRDVPADEPCGWRSRDFSDFRVSTRSQDFESCDGDERIEGAAVMIGIDGEPTRSLPETALDQKSW